MSDNNKAKKIILDVITGLPFILTVIIIATLLVFWAYIHPHSNYVVNSSVLTKDSYLEIDKEGHLKYAFNANLFDVIDKNETFQTDISEKELQRALLKKEMELLKIYHNNPDSAQANFDLGVWYLFTAGIRNNLSQMREGRQNRLLAGYYYLKRFNLMTSREKAVEELNQNINLFLNEKMNESPVFYNGLTRELSRTPDDPLEGLEREKHELLELFIEEKSEENLMKLCDYYHNNIDDAENSLKLAYIKAGIFCYSQLADLMPEDEDVKLRESVLKNKLKTFAFR
jgi:hypothetical protein